LQASQWQPVKMACTSWAGCLRNLGGGPGRGVENSLGLRASKGLSRHLAWRLAWPGKSCKAAICHAPWLLIEAGLGKGRRARSTHSIKTDVINAGAYWEDAAVVTDEGLITSRNSGDLEAFSEKIIEEVNEGGRGQARAA
jgi:DJ-1/PfpI family